MGAEFLVVILWGVVVAYWLWSRRPAFGDSIGLFRHELHALEHAGPRRVPPANRRRPLTNAVGGTGYTRAAALSEPGLPSGVLVTAGPSSLPEALAAASLSAKRLKTRRRRRDILSVLLGVVVVTAIAAVATRSMVAVSLQVLSDLALGAYAYLLVTRTKAGMARSTELRAPVTEPRIPSAGTWMPSTEPRMPSTEPRMPSTEPRMPLNNPAQDNGAVSAGPGEDWLIDLAGLDRTEDSYTPAHALWTGPRMAPGPRRPPAVRHATGRVERSSRAAYGDFDSYASLALAEAN